MSDTGKSQSGATHLLIYVVKEGIVGIVVYGVHCERTGRRMTKGTVIIKVRR